MTIEFIKVHTDKSDRSYKIGQIAEMDPAVAQELIRQGIAKERTAKPGEKPEGGEPAGKPKQ
jgi:hypothetical protein